jgi:cilia- and flagella-associated protein 43
MPTLKITKGKLGAKTKKASDGDDSKNAANLKMQQRDIKGMEEMFWAVKYQIDQLDEFKKRLENPNIWDMIYESYDLYSNPRKRMQIELLREVIFELKRDYNKEFDGLERFKEDQIFLIKEKNELIKELLSNLKTEDELFEPDTHILENPDHIFNVKESDVTVEKYLTKEERAKLEEERRKQEERERAMQGDNVGQRGLKTMMGGTELNLKKESNLAQMELVREDWMNKPQEQMSDEEKFKLKEFLQKEKEFKDKQRKAWEQDLKKIKSEIVEI